jgi:transposase-like protein
VIKHGSHRKHQRYLRKDCAHTFNGKTSMTLAHAKFGLLITVMISTRSEN